MVARRGGGGGPCLAGRACQAQAGGVGTELEEAIALDRGLRRRARLAAILARPHVVGGEAGQGHLERRSLADLAGHLDGAAVPVAQLLDEREPYAGAGRPGRHRIAGALETLEDALPIHDLDADAGVPDRELHRVAQVLHAHVDSAARRRVLERVA